MHPELWKPGGRKTNSVEEEDPVALGCVEATEREAMPMKVPVQKLRSKSIFHRNQFQDLADEEDDEGHCGAIWGIGSVEIAGEDDGGRGVVDKETLSLEVMEPEVNEVQNDPTQFKKRAKLKSAGHGEITIDSGAADSVLPAATVPGEPLVEGCAKKAGVKYLAACGTSMPNRGEKNVKFEAKDGNGSLASIKFQVTDVNKPLAAVSKIMEL